MTARVFGISTLAVVFAASVAGAQEGGGYRSGYVRTVEPHATLQRASEPASEEAVSNLPFLAGDRMWTDDVGRLEVVFADGSTIRVDSRTKLDFVSQEGGGRSERLVLRLWSGSVILHYRDDARSPEFTIETPEGALEARRAGIYRLDAEPGQARMAVLEGEGSVQTEGRLRVGEGQQVVIREGQVVRGPERVDASVGDEFARWDGQLQEQLTDTAEDRYLPQEVAPYGADFGANGRWDVSAQYGNVWYPNVEIGWAPYTHGYWAWTSYGWTWVPYERWGWATSHYGRWEYGGRGWYWIPGASWSPAWVGWSTGGDYVGWCPLGYGDRPVHGFHGQYAHGLDQAVPRGRVLGAGADHGAWTYVRRTDMGQRDVARRRVDRVPEGITQVHASPAARTRLSRDLRVVDALDNGAARPAAGTARAVPRNVHTRPGTGDTVQELRGDNTANIPHPAPRRHFDSEGERDEAAPASRTGAGTATRRSSPAPNATATRPPGDAPGADDAGRVRGGGTDRSRETVRPLFAPLSRPRPDDGTREGRDASETRERERVTRPRSSDDSTSRDSGRERPGFRSAPRTERQDDGARSSGSGTGSRAEPRPERRDDGGRSDRGDGTSRGSSGSSSGSGSSGSSGGGGGDRAQQRERPH